MAGGGAVMTPRAVWLLVARNAAGYKVVLEAWPSRAAARRALAARDLWPTLRYRIVRVPWGVMP